MKYATIEILREDGKLSSGSFVIWGVPPNGNYYVREFNESKKEMNGTFHQYLHDAVAHVERYQNMNPVQLYQ